MIDNRLKYSILYGILILSLAFFLYYLMSSGGEKRKRPQNKIIVKTAFVKTALNTENKIVFTETGKAHAKRRFDVYSQVSGILLKGSKLFRTGQMYNKNEILLKIKSKSTSYNLKAKKSALHSLLITLLSDLKFDIPEVFEKWNKYAVRLTLDKPLKNLPKFENEKERIFFSSRSFTSSYYDVKTLENQLNKHTIRTPFRGVLISSNITEGTLVRIGQKLGEYIDNSYYEIHIELKKTYINFVKTGDVVNVSDIKNTTNWKGKVVRINSSIDENNQTISLFIEVKGHSEIKQGMLTQVEFNSKRIQNTILLDRELLLKEDYIFIVKDNHLVKQKIIPLFFLKDKVVISGLPNDIVYLAKEIPSAYQGMEVRQKL